MTLSSDDVNRIAARTAELLGGHEAFRLAVDAEFAEIQAKWNQNTDTIGRILRAHLFVEHYLAERLTHENPNLGSPSDARLTFAQKLALLNSSKPDIADVLPGIKHLNAIRNRLAHNLGTQVTSTDASAFLRSRHFAALRDARDAKPTTDPMAVLEDFARHAAMVLSYGQTSFTAALDQAIAKQQLRGAA